MNYIDNHCHMFQEYYANIDEYIDKAIENHVTKIIVSGCDMNSNKEVLELCEKYDIVYGTLGFHPTELSSLDETSLSLLEKMVQESDKIVAIGEIGLDYHYPDTDKEKQKKFFIEQLKLANRLDLPVVIHSRDATLDTYQILKEYPLSKSGVIHCFSGSLEMAQEYIKLGYYIGIGGISTFKNANQIIHVIKNIDLHRILLETDAPYLTPVPYRGEVNLSAYIPIIAEKIAEIKEISLEEVAEITTSSSIRLFDF